MIIYLSRHKEEGEMVLSFDPISQKEMYDAYLVAIAKKCQSDF
jgi:hypothetical protein